MATFDQLSDEQRAIVELVLKQGKTYGELSEMLGLPEARVRELARDALVDLTPITARGVEQDWRGQLADYVLGQQAGPEATATRGHLRRSEAARSWTRSLLDALEQLYPNGDVPAIPDGERGSRRGAAAAPPTAGGAGPARRALAPEGTAAVRRRRLLTAVGVGGLILVAVLVWPLGLLTGDDDDEPSQASAGSQQEQGGGDGGPIATGTQGQAIVLRRQGSTQVLVTATGLEPSTRNTAYQVYVSNSDRDRRSLGATATDQQGNLQAGAQLPADFEDYQFIDLASVTVRGQGQNQRFEDGPTVLRGLIELRENPVSRGRGNSRITLLGDIRMLPLPD
jgi:Sigma-70, region 4